MKISRAHITVRGLASVLCAFVSEFASGGATTSVDELRVPATPAFTLLGVSPTNVERPSSARAFAVSVLSSAERGDGNVPTNLAMEVSPYWWTDHPELTFDKYYAAGFGQRVAQSLSISAASTELSTYRDDDDAKGTALAVGVRALLLGGKPAPELADNVSQLMSLQTKFLLECVPDIGDTDPPNPECPALEAKLRTQTTAVAALDRERVGLVLEAAAGVVDEFTNNDTRASDTSKYGAWLTWSYRSGAEHVLDDPTSLTVVAVQRWLRDTVADTDYIDVGARLIYKSKANRWSLSGEYLRRFANHADDTTSARATVEYVLSDRYTLTIALGRDFENPAGRSPLIAIAGLAMGWGGPAVGAGK
jgi:hypothetical protein